MSLLQCFFFFSPSGDLLKCLTLVYAEKFLRVLGKRWGESDNVVVLNIAVIGEMSGCGAEMGICTVRSCLIKSGPYRPFVKFSPFFLFLSFTIALVRFQT